MTAREYMNWCIHHQDPYKRSVNDPEFKAMDRRDQARVISAFDGYGFRDARRKAGYKDV